MLPFQMGTCRSFGGSGTALCGRMSADIGRAAAAASKRSERIDGELLRLRREPLNVEVLGSVPKVLSVSWVAARRG